MRPTALASLTLSLPSLITARDCSQATFKHAIPSNSTLNYVTKVAANSTFGDAYARYNATSVPAGCAVSVRVPTSSNSSYVMAIYLPDDWNYRIMTTGNGGFGGFTNWRDIGIYSGYGFAALTTDTGHDNVSSLDSTFALNKESLTDWGWRAMHGSVLLGKELTAVYYGEDAKYSYYSGCSTGGRQGLKELQTSPESFDGVFVGAPAWWIPHLSLFTTEATLANLPQNSSHHISSTLAGVINEEILRQCDPQDGVSDRIIMDPKGCAFDPLTLLCKPSSNTSACLNNGQLDTLYTALHDWTFFNGSLIFPTPTLGTNITAYIGDNPDPNPTGTGYVEHMLLNTTEPYDWNSFNESMVHFSDAVNPGHAAPFDYDISSFQKRGGKIIHFHGLADPTAEAVLPKGIKMDEFYRFFPIAGMGHCKQADFSPWYIGGASQIVDNDNVFRGVPGFDDAEHDGMLALMRWVEKGIAPKRLIATKWNDDDPAKGVYRQRPLCPFPSLPVYTSGDISVASSWKCS